jgi:uncharacterized protein (DUF3084 family)
VNQAYDDCRRHLIVDFRPAAHQAARRQGGEHLCDLSAVIDRRNSAIANRKSAIDNRQLKLKGLRRIG